MSDSSDTSIKAIFEASDAGEIHSGQVIEKLTAAGIISYGVDYRAGRITCYPQGNGAIEFHSAKSAKQIADEFDQKQLKAAIRGAQEGRVKFPEFKVLSQNAGCIGYTVWILGRHVTYFGKRGETHIEHFPSGSL